MRIERITATGLEDWIALRQALWPWSQAEHCVEVGDALKNPDAAAFLARDDGGMTAAWRSALLKPPCGGIM
jgi:hypothetical protein